MFDMMTKKTKARRDENVKAVATKEKTNGDAQLTEKDFRAKPLITAKKD